MSGARYSLHPGFAREAAGRTKIQETTGQTFEDWVERTKAEGPATLKEREKWLKEQHGFGTNYCSWIAEACDGPAGADAYNPEGYVEAQYSTKPLLVPLYEALLKLGFSIGQDVKACPCQTFVPLYRKHVFAQIKPTTRTRIDLGLALGDTPEAGRLVSTGGFEKKDRITHRIGVEKIEDIDDELRQWLRKAYERD